MKKILVVLLVVALALIGANAAMAAILGSKHDLSTGGPGPIKSTTGQAVTTTETCVFCHTPHGSNTAMKPLWNRAAGTDTFTPYGATLANTATAVSLSDSTLLCMSCHDGSQAMNVLYNAPGSGNIGLTVTTLGAIPAGVTNLTGNMSNDHPIGVVYTTGKAGLRAPSGAASPTPGTIKFITADAPLGISGTDLVQCASCHNPHGIGSIALFLPIANTSSAVCITCHIR